MIRATIQRAILAEFPRARVQVVRTPGVAHITCSMPWYTSLTATQRQEAALDIHAIGERLCDLEVRVRVLPPSWLAFAGDAAKVGLVVASAVLAGWAAS